MVSSSFKVVQMSGQVRLPDASNRVTVVGSTGSGKTRFGIWLFSVARYGNIPRILLDFKGDDLIAAIEDAGYAREISVLSKPPTKPGTYVVRPLPTQLAELDTFLWEVWRKGNVALFFDEGTMTAKSRAVPAILTQGRSKKIPVITLSQRPAWLSRYVFTESEYFAIFRLNNKQDRDTVRDFVNTQAEVPRLPYHSLWYDAGQDQAAIFSPVPGDAQIIEGFRPKKRGPAKRKL